MLKLICATKCSILHMHPQIHSQDSQHFTLTLTILLGAAVPHLERGTAAVRHYRTWTTALPWLKWPLGLGGTYTFSLPLQHLSSLAHSFSSFKNRRVPFSLLHWWPWAPKHSPLISPSIFERKRSQIQLESKSFDSPTQKSTWFTFWPVVVFITIGALLLAS